MGKKTTKTSTLGEGSDQRVQAANGASESTTTGSSKKGTNKSSTASQPSTSALVICRNKHWKYISSFHGPWLQLPLEVLETIANANYYMPLPRPVDPSVFYDLVKIRKLVDNATDLAVRAANGVSSPAMSNSSAGGGTHQMQALGLGFANNGGMKLSPERRFKLREQATQKLSRAYHIDEIASSVATMQSTSTLENVAGLVMQRAPEDPDANYVHFFHEKIPSRQLAECTDFRALDLIINQRHGDCEPLRTRAIVRMFKDDFEGAAQDLTRSLAVYRTYNSSSLHQLANDYDNMELEPRTTRRRDLPPLDERDQPRSTEIQVLFQRAGCYLTLACSHVEQSLLKRTSPRNDAADVASNETTTIKDASLPSPTIDSLSAETGPTKRELENRKAVRMYAKRALRDYMEYLKSLQYSPNMPIELSDEFTKLVNQANQRSRRHRVGTQDLSSPTDGSEGHTVYSLHQLFSATPPADLPAYPSTDLVSARDSNPVTTMEFVTYHPLLTDALHSLLLCHALIQTSAKELQRHAYMVARLARLADGYPVFQASRSPARADWIEILRRSESWLDLCSSWEALCAPAPLLTTLSPGGNLSSAAATANALAITGGQSPTESDEQRTDRLKHQAIIEALEDERVNDEASFRASILARQRRAEAEQAIASGVPANGSSATAKSPSLSSQKRWAVDDGREYPILTERAEAVALWVREAPAGSGVGGGKRKKKPGSAKKPASTPATDSAESLDVTAVR
ncbi:hypothetical protein PFICI_00506 [Pestalotiopsis fici W106-1]|uniref:Histidine kinase group protein n=1 Tax=Pestalotiopsis fici (strain W106-1 / CGMCC3.15140) TaxID=1229662 RepID=W3XKU1_PESFW|nr:uncharacterized protein PFICI_00506 [Pestalotiopsis fici W106-1]ETS86678.1 hypothetical protein PFICI_00506 [Pestalotiopsis fici W106-1]